MDLFHELSNEIKLIRGRYPSFKDDAAFVFWFLMAYLTDSEEKAKSALTGKEGGSLGEKNIDAIYIDHNAQQCNIIQGKYRTNKNISEKRNDVITFTNIGRLPWYENSEKESFFKKLEPDVATKLKEVVKYVIKKNYSVNLYYVTTGKCSETIIDEAPQILKKVKGNVEVFIFPYSNLIGILRNYVEGIAPAVPLLKIKIASDGNIQHDGYIRRFDPKTKIESWVFTAEGKSVGDLFTRAGIRLFAKNIRGYLGSSTDINNSMTATIKNEPHNFWYYNNGVTIVCNDANLESKNGIDTLKIEGAQVINGQQTTRTLQKSMALSTHVLIKVIKIPRSQDDDKEYDILVNTIVRSTNWQNAISPSDLISNDYVQVYLEREFRKRGYQYIRKKMSKVEAKSIFGQGYWQIDKRELAQAVGACILDPAEVRSGREGLFEDPNYRIIFKSNNLSSYLSKYWLMKQVHSISKGYPNRAYAKWIVLHFVWIELEYIISSGTNEKKFRTISEHKDHNNLVNLLSFITYVYRAVLLFYNHNKGEGEQAKDISTFFQRTKLIPAFIKFWKSPKNKYRKKAKVAQLKFIKQIKNYEIND